MTPEISYLILSVALTFILAVVAASGAILQVGLPTLAGNREGLPEMSGWVGRAQRAHRNMLENLILFAVAVFAAKAIGVSNAITLLGAQLFFWGRVAHAVLYIAGIPWALGCINHRPNSDLLAAAAVGPARATTAHQAPCGAGVPAHHDHLQAIHC